MARGKRKRLKLKSLDDANSNKQDEHDEFVSTFEIPFDLLAAIISRLTLQENIRASVVCKSWFVAATSVRVVNKTPWLMSCPKSGDTVKLYDPLKRKFYWIELPELQGSRICFAKDGWLLIYKPETKTVMFINPYTNETVKVPSFDGLNNQILAFSAAPTSSDCIIFTAKRHVNPEILSISTCRPGASRWTSANYRHYLPFVCTKWNKIVFCNGHFYCLSHTGWLGDYDSTTRKWTVHDVFPPPQCPEKFLLRNWWKSEFMAEYNGEILVGYKSRDLNPVIYKLDKTCKRWVEISTLGGMTFFANFSFSHVVTDLLGAMRNRIYFSRVRFYGKQCISYSLDDRRYYPRRENHDWGEDDPFQSIWIDAPDDVLALM